jgi:hypothetical protein
MSMTTPTMKMAKSTTRRPNQRLTSILILVMSRSPSRRPAADDEHRDSGGVVNRAQVLRFTIAGRGSPMDSREDDDGQLAPRRQDAICLGCRTLRTVPDDVNTLASCRRPAAARSRCGHLISSLPHAGIAERLVDRAADGSGDDRWNSPRNFDSFDTVSSACAKE